MGNVGSIENMLKQIGVEVKISSDKKEIENADKLIMPGVGSFDNGMSNLMNLDILPILHSKVILEKTPILGICLGMQLFTQKSEEGKLPGLGWIDAETNRFNFNEEKFNLKIPHMGWNTINIKQQNSIFHKQYDESRYYFVHSYYVRCANENNVLATTQYGIEFHSAIVNNNIIGTQFHPEKSHKYGKRVLQSFLEI